MLLLDPVSVVITSMGRNPGEVEDTVPLLLKIDELKEATGSDSTDEFWTGTGHDAEVRTAAARRPRAGMDRAYGARCPRGAGRRCTGRCPRGVLAGGDRLVKPPHLPQARPRLVSATPSP